MHSTQEIYPTPVKLQISSLLCPLLPLCSVTFQSYGDLSLERRVQTALLLTAQSGNAATSNNGGKAIREENFHHLLPALLC